MPSLPQSWFHSGPQLSLVVTVITTDVAVAARQMNFLSGTHLLKCFSPVFDIQICPCPFAEPLPLQCLLLLC